MTATTTTAIPRVAYEMAFARECEQVYPAIDAVEARYGHAIDRTALDAVARVLACPVKVHAPNWQHGRVLYAVTRHYLDAHPGEAVLLLDIGTAKGFSAWCLQRALLDAGRSRGGHVVSVDVIDPLSTRPRNSIADCDGPHALRELHDAWPEMASIDFLQSTGLEWLRRSRDRVHVAFVDGKHEGSVVYHEGKDLAKRQRSGDVAIFDDVHLPTVSQAVHLLGQQFYRLDWVEVLPHRAYAIGVRQ